MYSYEATERRINEYLLQEMKKIDRELEEKDIEVIIDPEKEKIFLEKIAELERKREAEKLDSE